MITATLAYQIIADRDMPLLAANIAEAQTVDASECDCRFYEDSYSCTDCGMEVV